MSKLQLRVSLVKWADLEIDTEKYISQCPDRDEFEGSDEEFIRESIYHEGAYEYLYPQATDDDWGIKIIDRDEETEIE